MDKKSTYSREHFLDYLRSCGMRATQERVAIFDAAVCQTRHFCVDDLRCILADNGFLVSTATIYNNIRLLIDAGVVQRAHVANASAAYFERSHNTSHIRLVCSSCGRTREVRSAALTQQIKSQDFKTFAPRHFVLDIYGMCRKCERQAKHPKP